MANNLPIRGLGAEGILSDIHPYDLPPNALSAGVNVRFENGKIARGPVWRTVWDYTAPFAPGYCFAIPPITEGSDQIVAVSYDGSQILSLQGSAAVNVTNATPTVSVSENPWTHTFLGSVAYLNRADGVPLQRRPNDATFQPLTAWDATHRCGSLRSYKDFLIALDVTKAGTEYPTMVKWSDIAQFGGPPATWDPSDTTASAGENIVNEMRSRLIDGLTLKDYFILYCEDEVWVMSYIGGNFLFQWRKLYDRCGIINQNCVVQVDSLHYVFDRNDIYVHDGATKRSIVHGKNKDYIFDSLIYDLKHLCFVAHHPHLTEIHFCYASGDRLAGFQNPTTGCNRAAVYNYANDTWSFYDLPNVTGHCLSNIPTGDAYDTVGDVTYDQYGGTYKGADDDQEQHSIFSSRIDASQNLTASRLLGLDLIIGGRLTKPLCTEAVKSSFIERVGIDLDEEGVPLPMYKVIHTIYPQLGLEGDQPIQFQFGASDIVDKSPAWGGKLDFDPRTTSKVDTGRIAGRYLAYRVYYTGDGDFSLSGLDAKLKARGRRG